MKVVLTHCTQKFDDTNMKILFTLFLLLSCTAAADKGNEEDAKKAILSAFYKQSGIEDNVNRFIENKIIPPEHKEMLGRVSIIVKTVVTQKVEATWSF